MPGSRFQVLIARILVLVLALLAVGPARAQDAGWLYVVDVPVADQSPAARQQAAREALAVVLSRLTGLARLPDDARIRSALGNPDRYYVQFGYAAGAAPDATNLRVQFSPPALFELIRATGLPIWPSARPVIRAWLVLDDGTGPRFVDAAADQAMLAALAQRAQERGLVIRVDGADGALPAPGATPAVTPVTPAEPADATGSTVGVPAAVTREPLDVPLHPPTTVADAVRPTPGLWDAAAADIVAASPRDRADLPLVARIGSTAAGAWAARWELVEEPPVTAPAATRGEDANGPPNGSANGSANRTMSAAPANDAAEGTAPAAAGAGPAAATAGAPDAAAPAPEIFEARAATAEELAGVLVDQLVDRLLGRYQVVAGASRLVAVSVGGIGNARAYAQVLGLFGGVEVIDDVAVVAAEGDRIRFNLTTMAALEQLQRLVTADGRLVADVAVGLPAELADAPVPVPDAVVDPAATREPDAGADLVLLWQER